MFWLGGFTFYAAVVVPIGTEVLGSPAEQGWITQRVTNWLNVAGAVALAGWAWDIAADAAPTRLRQGLRWLLWVFLVLMLAVLVALHPPMDALLDSADTGESGHTQFRTLHRIYLWVSTAQWAVGIALSFATLRTWSRASVGNAALTARKKQH